MDAKLAFLVIILAIILGISLSGQFGPQAEAKAQEIIAKTDAYMQERAWKLEQEQQKQALATQRELAVIEFQRNLGKAITDNLPIVITALAILVVLGAAVKAYSSISQTHQKIQANRVQAMPTAPTDNPRQLDGREQTIRNLYHAIRKMQQNINRLNIDLQRATAEQSEELIEQIRKLEADIALLHAQINMLQRM
ncbi:MAG: hypothetical protein KA988_05065 [Longilinea sp.]|nr:hypothetical protein [Longilinea sp.]